MCPPTSEVVPTLVYAGDGARPGAFGMPVLPRTVGACRCRLPRRTLRRGRSAKRTPDLSHGDSRGQLQCVHGEQTRGVVAISPYASRQPSRQPSGARRCERFSPRGQGRGRSAPAERATRPLGRSAGVPQCFSEAWAGFGRRAPRHAMDPPGGRRALRLRCQRRQRRRRARRAADRRQAAGSRPPRSGHAPTDAGVAAPRSPTSPMANAGRRPPSPTSTAAGQPHTPTPSRLPAQGHKERHAAAERASRGARVVAW